MGVVLGPSAALDLALAGSLSMAAATALRASGSGRLARVAHPLAGLGTLAAAAYAVGFRPWLLRWGVTDDELRRSLPGDELIPRPMFEANHAVTINAPPEAVWPWLVQIGTGRAGWYSYDFLENLSGIEVHSADQIVPDLQNLKAGDQVFIAPGYGFVVAEITPARTLVLRSFNPITGSPTDLRAGGTIDITWAFVLDAVDPSRTRLIARYRVDGRPRRGAAALMVHLVEIPHFVMERKMLLGIKGRAERSVAHGTN